MNYCENAFATSDALTYTSTHSKLWWYNDIGARSKTDKTEALSGVELVPCFDITHNPAGEDTSDLLNDYA